MLLATIMLSLSALKSASTSEASRKHPYDPYCATCNMEETAKMHGYGATETYIPDLHRGDKGIGHVVFTSDALHHGTGIMMTVKGNRDILRKKPNETTLDQAMKNTENEAAKAEIEVKEKEKEVKRLEKEIAEKKAHQLRHETEMLENEKKRIENLKKKRPEIFAKSTVPVVVFNSHGFPFYHHQMKLLKEINAFRAKNRDLIDSQQKIAKLDDITDKMAAMNPNAKDAKDYDNILSSTGADKALLSIPISPSNGNFYISRTSHPRPNSGGDHPENAAAHSNLPPKAGFADPKHAFDQGYMGMNALGN